jgi:hypothetical protein
MVVQQPRQRGSIYVLTLLTVAAVGSMVLIGVSVRTATSAESTITENINANNDGVVSAAEFAIAKIINDADWVTNAQKGSVFSDFTLGDRSYSSTVVDADTLATPTDDSLSYRITITSSNGVACESARFELQCEKFDYKKYLESLGAEAYWPMDEDIKESKADDPIGHRDGEYLDLNTSGASTNDEGGQVPVFANSGDHVETPYNAAYQDDAEGTVSMWMYFTGDTSTPYGVFGQQFETGGYANVAMMLMNGVLTVYMDDSGSFSYSRFAWTMSKVINASQWHHVAMTWGPAGVRIYVDGSQVGSNPALTEYWDTKDSILTGRQPVTIGGCNQPIAGSQPFIGFEGSIARFAILSDQLNAAAIAELAATKPDAAQMVLVEESWAPVFE